MDGVDVELRDKGDEVNGKKTQDTGELDDADAEGGEEGDQGMEERHRTQENWMVLM